ncbi:MAG: hypothetical protein ACK5S6_04590, partial [bacterium]
STFIPDTKGFVSAAKAQTFTNAEQATARGNIGVVVWEGQYFEDTGTYAYYGGLANNAWKINRYTTEAVKTSATVDNNPGVLTLSAAWSARAGLVYT